METVTAGLPCASEMPVELWVNNKRITTFFCTPSDLEDLAVGHLLTRGYIPDIREILDISVDEESFVIRVATEQQELTSLYSVSEIILSGCSAVSEFSSRCERLNPVSSDCRIRLDMLKELGAYMVEHGVIYERTGGVHAALLASEGSRLVREDIGRHNAVDKAVGAAARAGLSCSDSVLITTGRISLDMALKAASASIPVIGTLKYPSDLGVRLCEQYRICIAAGILSKKPLIYTAADRITDMETE